MPAQFLGEEQCTECHLQQSQLWSGSHHDLAMQLVNEKTVLGDFDQATFNYNGIETLFYRKNDHYFVRTDGEKGELEDFQIKYAFGVEPLQQYLIELDNGRIQALGIAWDTREESAGGQRWFHLYEDENVTHKSPFHWTATDQNWNNMCAACHSTNLKKNFDLGKMTFNTTYSQIDVSCEACHGPGSDHVEWAKQQPSDGDQNKGLLVNLNQIGQWIFDEGAAIASLNEPLSKKTEIETCARCHSRRSDLWPDYKHGKQLLDTHLPALLRSPVYHHDGQINEEVYVYGSFLQSKMYKQGVTCSNCHDPHSLKLKAQGNALCTQCHLSSVFESNEHHFHQEKTAGAECVSCHMTQKTFMQIDERADHSFRVPRPDLSIKIGSPNACTLCHDGRTDEWAAQTLEKWYGEKTDSTDSLHYGEVFYASEKGAVNAEKMLNQLAQDPRQNSIVKATAVLHIASNLSPVTSPAMLKALRSREPLVKVAVISVLENFPAAEKTEHAEQFLFDDLRIIRMEAARVLADSRYLMKKPAKEALDKALDEYINSQLANGERAESHVNLANLYLRMGDSKKAEETYLKSIQINSGFVPAYVNLADLYRQLNNDEKAEQVLNQGFKQALDEASLHHAYGLLKVRQKKVSEALDSLSLAVQFDPDNVQYQYVYGIGLNSSGKTDQAISVLNQAHQQRPSDRRVLSSLVSIYSETGNHELARIYAEKLFELSPWDKNIQTFLQQF